LKVAAKDATVMVVVVQLGTGDRAAGVESPVNFSRQQHANGRRDEVNPE
jgi:hypothetical protein